jgi:hypothetical protein
VVLSAPARASTRRQRLPAPGVLSGFVSIFFGAFATLFSLGATTASAS